MKTKSNLRISRLGTTALAALLIGVATAQSTTTGYNVTIIGPASADRFPSLGVDATGRLAGRTLTIDEEQMVTTAWTYNSVAGYRLSPAKPSSIQAVSPDGMLVGSAYGAPTLFDWNGNPVLALPNIAGSFLAVNENHDVAGYIVELGSNGPKTAVVYDRFGNLMRIAPIGTVDSTACGLSSRGAVVGYAIDEGGQTRGFYWSGVAQVLPGLPGNSDFAVAVNGSSVVVGFAVTPNDQVLPVRWVVSAMPVQQTIVELPQGFTNGFAQAINDNGQTVGAMWTDTSAPSRAFVSTPNGSVVDLNELKSANARSYLLTTANAINASGVIVGTAIPLIYGQEGPKTLAYVAVPAGTSPPR
jgi:probable HAF family extracellular repeat protein